ncbi:transcriptional regulator, LacI family [Microbacterium sp. cf046]|uniref:LacI family DNA-binding transcriptional regulator n=1 Tax=Microbacterium sp. cf046 TaxID=1761803 RepID=UPI0008F2C405|nr:LacI family DNA-binding transcriptional regulator [Microbacterium sp. cf046]SFS14463.1 transcriptional regulator, LacI family [Microbacterium sp. cf046]
MSEPSPARPTGRVGVREVARAAGVSTQTVSRVINDHPGIRDETRQRVLDAMVALDYRVNNAARALGTSRTRTIGILASDASMYGPAVGILALEAAARAAGRWVTAAYADAGDAESVVEAARHLSAQGVDGIVVVAPHARTLSAIEGARLGLAVVALHGPDSSAVQREAAEIAVAHLAELGHSRIGHLAGPEDWLEAVARAEGFEAALAARSLTPASVWRGDWSAASGLAVSSDIARAVRSGDGPTALFVANDQMALGVIAGLADAGVAVPADLSVVGVDDNPDAAYYRPALTTVRLDVAGEAAHCIAEVLGIERPAASDAPTAPLLIPRASSAPRPRASG